MEKFEAEGKGKRRRFPYHKRYHADALRGMARLSLEERGAYDLVLDLTYEKGGPVVDDDIWLARQANCSVKKWRAVKASLVAAEKLIVERGFIWNVRALEELGAADRLALPDLSAETAAGPSTASPDRKAISSASSIADEPPHQSPIDAPKNEPGSAENNDLPPLSPDKPPDIPRDARFFPVPELEFNLERESTGPHGAPLATLTGGGAPVAPNPAMGMAARVAANVEAKRRSHHP